VYRGAYVFIEEVSSTVRKYSKSIKQMQGEGRREGERNTSA